MFAHLSNLLLSLALHSPVLLTRQLSLVKTSEVKVNSGVDTDGKEQHTNGSSVSRAVVRLVLLAEEEGGGDTSRVSDSDEDTTGESTLAVSGLVDGNPGHT